MKTNPIKIYTMLTLQEKIVILLLTLLIWSLELILRVLRINCWKSEQSCWFWQMNCWYVGGGCVLVTGTHRMNCVVQRCIDNRLKSLARVLPKNFEYCLALGLIDSIWMCRSTASGCAYRRTKKFLRCYIITFPIWMVWFKPILELPWLRNCILILMENQVETFGNCKANCQGINFFRFKMAFRSSQIVS